MSQVGLYRYKVDNLVEGETTINLYKNGSLAVIHNIIVKSFCESQKLVKYLDNNGQYRFYSFNSRWESSDKVKLLGKANKLITSILTSQSNERIIGYKNERTLNLTADNVSSDELLLLQYIWTSPRVYLHVGEYNSDEDSDWLLVTVSGGDKTVKRRKLENAKFNIELLLPEWFSVSML
jgi:hypothetical protein